MREIVHLQAGQCGNQIGAKVFQIFGLYCFAFAKLKAFFVSVLGGDLGRTWHRPYWNLPR